MNIYEVISCPTTELSYTNRAIINNRDEYARFEHIAVRYPASNEAFVFSIIASDKVGPGKLAFNLSGRKWASLQTGKQLQAAPYKFEPKSQILNAITFSTDFATKKPENEKHVLDTDEMSKQFSIKFVNQAFTVGQIVGFAFEKENKKHILELKVQELAAVSLGGDGEVGTSNVEIGLTTANTIAVFERAENASINLVGGATSMMSAPQILSPNWDLASMGIGGLSNEFSKLFRRAFASRLLPPAFAQKIGEQHVKGILLYGPPGTGKTLMARQIGNMLHAREPKIVNGPEVLNKYVGESEANIRKLFEDAEKEQKAAGVNSGLHIIIFDEIDAICKARGSSASTSGAGDNVVNQLLTKIDGVDALNNVLLIGMTNRKDLIDEAFLRPGRLELQIEVGLPDEDGRLEIFVIHTQALRDNDMLAPDVDLKELAKITKNFTGAEISGLVRAAKSWSYNRNIKAENNFVIDQELLKSIKITRDDFQKALDDVKPALGASEDTLKPYAQPIIHWNTQIHELLKESRNPVDIVQTADTSSKGFLYSMLYLGEPGSGLTSLAANLASETKFPLIRFFQPSATDGMAELAKVELLKKIFTDAEKSQLSCIVFDNIDQILEYSPIGTRFSYALLKTFKANINRALPKGRRILLICTSSSKQFIDDLSLAPYFKKIVKVPSITSPDHVDKLMSDLEEQGDITFSQEQRKEIVEKLQMHPFKIGVKHLLDLLTIDAPKDEPSCRVQYFLSRLQTGGYVEKMSRLF